MKLVNRVILCSGLFALALAAWLVALNAASAAETQLSLMRQAEALMADGIYIRAAELLEEAASYNTKLTPAAEEELKKAYLPLIGKNSFRKKYTALLEKQISRKDAGPEVFEETALHYIGISRMREALDTLKAGISKTGSEELTALYERNRYGYETSRDTYDYAASIHNSAAQVCTDGMWGIARADGSALIPCQYEQTSTFDEGMAVVKNECGIFAVDKDNNRIAMLHENALAFGNYSSGRIPLQFSDGWRRATGDFELGSAVFEYIGMYSGGYAAAKSGGKWGVVDLSLGWLIPAEYDGIITDELGRCYGKGAVFVQNGENVLLFVDGKQADCIYENARPFLDGDYAAVMKEGKWGYADVNGKIVIDCKYDDALSFGQHLAAVRQGELWGYISVYGQIAIEPVFMEAKSFSNGSAPVLTARGWQFITLLESKHSGPGLFS